MNYQKTSKPLCATSIDTGEQIIFPSINQASKYLHINPGQISNCCKHQYTATSKGNGEIYEFTYSIDESPSIDDRPPSIDHKPLSIDSENLNTIGPSTLMDLLELLCEFIAIYEDEDNQTYKALREKGINTLDTMLNRDTITLEQYRALRDSYFESI